jgi:hypothetical protein
MAFLSPCIVEREPPIPVSPWDGSLFRICNKKFFSIFWNPCTKVRAATGGGRVYFFNLGALMQDVLNYANLVVDFFKAGFTQVNLTLALVIALYWAWRISNLGALVMTAIGAVLMHLVALILAPMVDHNAPLHLPPFQDAAYWRLVAALFLGYTVAIGALFLVKSAIVNRAGASDEGGGMLAASAHDAGGHHGGGHEDHGPGGAHDDHGHGGHGHDDHGHGGGHDDHGHGGGHDDHGHGGHGHH